MDQSSLIPLLAGNPTFQGLAPELLADFVRRGRLCILQAGDHLLRQKQTGQPIWLLLEGELEVLVDGEVVNHVSEAGALLGEISAVSLSPATASVRCLGEVRAMEISLHELHEAMKQHPDLGRTMLQSMVKYLGRK